MTRPLQVHLDEQDFDRLGAWARERGWTKSQAIRAAVRALTRGAATDPVMDLSGDIDGLPRDLSERFDQYLSETFIAAPSQRPAPRRPRKAIRR
jgi:hypothetical protein